MASPVGSVYVQLGIDSAEFKSGLESAQDSAKVFAREIDRVAGDFHNLESALSPATAALRQYEAAQKTAANAVRLGAATQAQADAVLVQARARYEAMTATLARGAGGWRNTGSIIQQAGFQVGDFAVQVASGQNPLRAFIQQGTQVAGVFGPWGAVIGAAGAVVGALATSLLTADEASEEMADSAEDAAGAASALQGRIGDLESVARAYADAIANTAGAQVDATDTIVAQTRREFEAKKELLELEVKRAGIQRDLNRRQLETLRGDLKTSEAQPDVLQIEDRLARERGYPPGGVLSVPPDVRAEIARQASAEVLARNQAQAELRDEVKELAAQTELLDLTVDKGNELLNKPFEEIAAGRGTGRGGGGSGGGGSRGGGGSGSAAQPQDLVGQSVEQMRERIQLLQEEQRLIGVSEQDRVRLAAAFDRERMVREILLKAEREGVKLTPEQIVLVEQHAAAIEELTLANAALGQELRDQASAAEEAERRHQELNKAIAATSDRFIGAIREADSFGEALRNVALEVANLALQGALGEGPWGNFLGPLAEGFLGNLFGGSSAPSSSPIPVPRPRRYAAGGVADGWAMVGERGRELVHFGAPARVHSNSETERMLRGGGRTEANLSFNFYGPVGDGIASDPGRALAPAVAHIETALARAAARGQRGL